MWQRYRQTALFTQTFIVLACAGAYVGMKEPLKFVVIAFIMMQIGAIFGAYWSARLIQKMQADSQKPQKK